jgi:sulfhydrogenase subunit beta (sulfur reductase)
MMTRGSLQNPRVNRVTRKTIDKKKFNSLLKALKKDNVAVYAPVMHEGILSIAEASSDDDVMLDFSNSKLPVKRQMFPWSEVLYSYDGDKVKEAPLQLDKRVIFGARPCDTQSLAYLDRVFLDEKYTDPYYKNRRDNTVIISVACTEPLSTCFCTSVNGNPAGTQGTDIIVHDLKDELLFEICTDKGKSLISGHMDLFREPEESHGERRNQQVAKAEKKVAHLDLKDISKKLKASFESPVWKEIAGTCLGCGACTFMCPTCHCFSVHDENFFEKGERVRVQDACMYKSFSLEVSGHNPRKLKKDRMRQRVMHKFQYTDENFGNLFCVGCGRCISGCPVNIDIRETLAEVAK